GPPVGGPPARRSGAHRTARPPSRGRPRTISRRPRRGGTMKTLEPLTFQMPQCRKEVDDLRNLLKGKGPLKGRDQILPFFKQRPHLSAFLASGVQGFIQFDRVAHELELLGSFLCDLVVGDSTRHRYAFIEFEDAAPNSLFVKRRSKAT